MKILIKKFSWWLVLPFFCLVVLIGCKSREKQVQKSENQSEYKSESTARIEEKTFEIIFDKSVLKNDFSYRSSAEETGKTEKKNIDKGKEYYENGNLKKEWERDLSEQSEFSKKSQTELQEKLSKSEETSKYWQESTDHFYKALEQEKKKTSNYEMKLKAKETFTWQMFFVGLMIGWIVLPGLLRWIISWIKRFQPFIILVDSIKNLKKNKHA